MAHVITKALVLPNLQLSLEIARDASEPMPDTFRVSVTEDDDIDPAPVLTDVELIDDAGFDPVKRTFFLPRAVELAAGSIFDVVVHPMASGIIIGAASAAVQVSTGSDSPDLAGASPEVTLRQMLADAITSLAIIYESESVWVYRDRMGRPRTSVGNIGKSGPIVEVGIPYMTTEDPFANSTDTDTSLTIPIKILVKADHPDRGEDAVNIAWLIRRGLRETFNLEGYGILGWTWSGEEPTQEGQKLLVLRQTMTFTQLRC